MRKKLPVSLNILILLILLSTVWQAVRFATAIAWRDTLGTYAPNPGPVYIAASGALWTGVGLFVLWSFWRGFRWTRAAILIASAGYGAWSWADRLLVQSQNEANWPFDLAVLILLLVFTAVVVLHPHHRIYFEREAYERESKSPPSA